MTLGKHLSEQLRNSANPNATAPQTVSAEHNGTRADVKLRESDRFSGTIESITVHGGAAPADPQRFLQERSADIARDLDYLEEPLAVWEIAAEEGKAQLRSSPPRNDGEQVSYWEVEVDVNGEPSVSIARYSWQPGQPERELQAEPATYSSIGRIADTLAKALEEE